MRLRARIGITLLGLAVAGALAYGFMPRPQPVDIATVEKGPLMVTIEDEGKTRVMDRYVVSAPITGFARRIDFHVGDAIKRGQVLATIEPIRSDALDPRSRAQAGAQASAAEAALAAARENARAAAAQADLARQELERAESLLKSNFVSQQAVDRARTERNRTQAVLQATEHAVRRAMFDLENARAALASANRLEGRPMEALQVHAPADARVLKINHESEGTVQTGQPLIEIGNPDALEVEVDVLSTDAVKIPPGSKVLLERWGGPTLEAAVRTIEPAGFTKISALGVEEQRVHVIADITSPREQWKRLGDGYRVEARFVIWEGKDILQAPTSALFRHDSGWAVFVVDAGRARLRPVVPGQRAGLRTEIASGLKPGERVVAHPDDKIREGTRVTGR